MSYTNGLDKPSDYFTTKLYSGNGGTLNVTGLDFQPDWCWLKQRNGTYGHDLYDVVRSATKTLNTNNTNAEYTSADRLTSFNSDGFTLGSNASVNGSSDTYASWNWKAGTSFTNDASATGIGSIDSTGSVNTDAGFSIGTYTGNGTDGATVGTGLTGLSLVIAKCRNATGGWVVKHQSLSGDNNVYLQITNAAGSAASAGSGGIGALNNSTFPLVTGTSGASSSQVNKSGNTHVFYAFAEKQGYSKFGSYTGNDNADGTFVYLGFKPAFVMIKRTNSVNDWIMLDNKRNGFNVVDDRLLANTNAAEATTNLLDFTSTGMKMRATYGGVNGASDNFIYMAFAEESFVSSSGVPATAR